MHQKKNKLKRCDHLTFIDRCIAVSSKITGSGDQMELKLHGHHFYKAEREKIDKLIETAKKQRKEEI